MTTLEEETSIRDQHIGYLARHDLDDLHDELCAAIRISESAEHHGQPGLEPETVRTLETRRVAIGVDCHYLPTSIVLGDGLKARLESWSRESGMAVYSVS